MSSTKGAVNPHLLSHVRVGDELEVWWPLDRLYYSGRVESVLEDGRHRIAYEDGDVEDLVLAAEQWRFKGAAAERVTAELMLAPGVNAAPGAVQEVEGSDVSSEALDRAGAAKDGGGGPGKDSTGDAVRAPRPPAANVSPQQQRKQQRRHEQKAERE